MKIDQVFAGKRKPQRLHRPTASTGRRRKRLSARNGECLGYRQLYGIRIAKLKTNRFMLCSQCQDGHELEPAQWEQALERLSVGKGAPTSNLSMRDAFPAVAADR